MNPEVGTNRMLEFIGKNHTCEDSIRIFNAIRNAHPDIILSSTVMIGLPSETDEDIKELAKLIGEIKIDVLHINYFIVAPRQPLAKYPQMTEKEKEAHLQLLLDELPTYLTRDLKVDHNLIIPNEHKERSDVKKLLQELEAKNKESLFPLHYVQFRHWDSKNRIWILNQY